MIFLDVDAPNDGGVGQKAVDFIDGVGFGRDVSRPTGGKLEKIDGEIVRVSPVIVAEMETAGTSRVSEECAGFAGGLPNPSALVIVPLADFLGPGLFKKGLVVAFGMTDRKGVPAGCIHTRGKYR